MIDYLKIHPDIVDWNDKGEIVYHGRLINGSNISDLIGDAMSNHSKFNIPPFYESRKLTDVNVPNDWIKNNKRLNIRSHKYDDVEDKKDLIKKKKKKKKKKFNSVESIMSFKTKLIYLFRRVKCNSSLLRIKYYNWKFTS